MTQLFTVNGIDAFGHLKEGSLTHEVSGIARRATLSAVLYDMPGLDNLQRVEWDDSDGTHFLGFISKLGRKTKGRRGQGVAQSIACRDISFRAYDLMISSKKGRRKTFEFSDVVVKDVIGAHWPEVDVANVTAHVTLKPKDYTQFTVGDFLDDIAKRSGPAVWYVDADLKLHFKVPSYASAPWNISDQPNGSTLFDWEPGSDELGDEAEEINNRIYTRAANLSYKNYQDDASVARYGVRYGSINSTERMTRAAMAAAANAMLAEKAWPSREASLTLLQPGLAPGMEVAITSLDYGLTAAPHFVVSVSTRYPQWNSPRYTITMVGNKDRPIAPDGGSPPSEPGPTSPARPTKTLAEELRKKRTGPGAGSDEADACCPPPPPFKPKPETADGSAVQCIDEPNFADGTTATLNFGTAPTVGNVIVCWIAASVDIFNPDAPAFTPDFDFPFHVGPTARGWDPAQYGGPGGPVRISMFWRVVDDTDTGTYVVDDIPNDPQDSHVYMCEFAGIGGTPEMWSSETTMFGGGTYPVGTGLAGFVVGGQVHQRTDYAPPDVVTVNGATTHWNADLDGGTSKMWVVLGYGGAPWSTSIEPNPYLDRWGRGAVALAWAAGETETLVPETGQDIPWEGGVSNGTSGDHVTNYPYEPGSLIVIADGVTVIPSETDPDTGQFAIPVYPAGTKLAWRYQAQNGIETGADNAPALPSSPGVGSMAGRWEPVTNGDVSDPEIVFEAGDVVMEYVP